VLLVGVHHPVDHCPVDHDTRRDDDLDAGP
jgi:hypothetical protein